MASRRSNTETCPSKRMTAPEMSGFFMENARLIECMADGKVVAGVDDCIIAKD
uniref:hypothetical protein n=1 Tax=Nitrosomonas sp. Nm33 TaxID=133724 RepID=UPI0015A0EC0C|nr:hypothetical protein [Nitrosomonas sp. Nm33]